MFETINDQTIGLLFKNDNYAGMLEPGRHFIWPGQTLEKCVRGTYLGHHLPLNVLLKDTKLKDNLRVIEVKDNELAMHFKNGNFQHVLVPGKYGHWKDDEARRILIADLNDYHIDNSIDRNLFTRTELAPYLRSFNVESWEKGLLFVDNKFEKVLEPGVYTFWKNPTPIQVLKADTRQLQLEVSGQEILTKDKAALRVNFFCQYKITDAIKAVVTVKEYEKQLYILLQVALREYIGGFTLDEMLEKKESVGPFIAEKLIEPCAETGLQIINSGIRDIILPGEIRDIMNQVLVAEKKAQANTIFRREETASTRSLLNTAKLMEENELLFRLKELEYIERISDKISGISINGGTQILEQLKQLFVPAGKKKD